MTLQYLRIVFPILFWLFFVPLRSAAQFNLEAGYSYSFYEPTSLNALLQTYEGGRQDLSSSLGDTKGFHGLEFTGIYNWEAISIGAFGSLKRDRNEIEFSAIDGTSTLEESVVISNSLVGLVLQSNIEQFSIGTRIGYDFYKLKFTGNSEYPDRELKINGGLASQFYLSYTVPGGELLRISLRPYYQINWYTPDLQDLANMLKVNNTDGKRGRLFGLSLIFINGRKNGY